MLEYFLPLTLSVGVGANSFTENEYSSSGSFQYVLAKKDAGFYNWGSFYNRVESPMAETDFMAMGLGYRYSVSYKTSLFAEAGSIIYSNREETGVLPPGLDYSVGKAPLFKAGAGFAITEKLNAYVSYNYYEPTARVVMGDITINEKTVKLHNFELKFLMRL